MTNTETVIPDREGDQKSELREGDQKSESRPSARGETRPVIVCTARRAVVFGYASGDINADPITLTKARMCLYWPRAVGGVFGLGENGPDSDTRVSAPLDSLLLKEVTAVFSVTPQAEEAWNAAPVHGR